jgi:crossover junction endodeoxyribonuclease RusA
VVNGRPIISKQGREFRSEVEAICLGSEALLCGLSVQVNVFPPDRRRRDLDNILKATLDAMQHGGVYADDSQIHRLLVEREHCTPGGMLKVKIVEFDR